MALREPASPPARRVRPTSVLLSLPPWKKAEPGIEGASADVDDDDASEGGEGLNASCPRNNRRNTKSVSGASARVRADNERGERTAPEEDAARDPISTCSHESSDVETSRTVRLPDLLRDLERAQLLAVLAKRLGLRAALDDFDLTRHVSGEEEGGEGRTNGGLKKCASRSRGCASEKDARQHRRILPILFEVVPAQGRGGRSQRSSQEVSSLTSLRCGALGRLLAILPPPLWQQEGSHRSENETPSRRRLTHLFSSSAQAILEHEPTPPERAALSGSSQL